MKQWPWEPFGEIYFDIRVQANSFEPTYSWENHPQDLHQHFVKGFFLSFIVVLGNSGIIFLQRGIFVAKSLNLDFTKILIKSVAKSKTSLSLFTTPNLSDCETLSLPLCFFFKTSIRKQDGTVALKPQ